MWFKSVCVVLTRKCNADCDICFYECSNTIDEKIDVIRVMEVIRELRKKEKIGSLGITGGEPLLFTKDFYFLLEESRKLGIGNLTFTTNGFWGKDPRKAYEILQKVKKTGISFFTLSVDDFHEKFVPYHSIRNIITIAKELSIKIVINTVSTKKSGRLKGVLAELEDILLECDLIELPCMPVGFAAKRLLEEDFLYLEKCPEAACSHINTFTMMSNGDVYPCLETGLTSVFSMGNIYELSTEKILNNFYRNKIYYILAQKGPKYIYDNFVTDNKIKKKYVSVCHLCRLLFDDESTKNEILKKVIAYDTVELEKHD